ncbi:MAG: Smr/MutS family protein, partial [Anaerolineales bacterium]|nr:Smr/MutS family protein [Anaerolineales bacterium]
QDRVETEQARERAQALEAELARRLGEIDDERVDLLERARLEAGAEVEAVQEQLGDLRRRLSIAAQPLEALEAVESEIETLEDQITEPVSRPTADINLPARSIRPGDRVRLHSINATGVVTDLSPKQAEVQIGRLRIRTRLDELTPLGEDEPAPEYRRSETRESSVRKGIAPAPPLELDLRGHTVDEGLEELERRLDAAYLAGMPFVRVIHGKGTGRLREAIRQALHGNPYVASFEPGKAREGGDGVTVVQLANV